MKVDNSGIVYLMILCLLTSPHPKLKILLICDPM